jgi:hypothetical protein
MNLPIAIIYDVPRWKVRGVQHNAVCRQSGFEPLTALSTQLPARALGLHAGMT